MNTVILVLLGSEDTADVSLSERLDFEDGKARLTDKTGNWQEAGFYRFDDGFYRNTKGQWRMGFLVDQWGVKWTL